MTAKTGNDLGKDKISTLLIKLAVPAIAAQIINALYNIVDRMYIGRMPGGNGALALTGVGLTFPIITLISAFSGLVGMGGAPRTSIKMGAGDKEGAEKILGNCFVMLVGISIALTVVFQVFMEPLLYMFGASDQTIGFALQYLRIYVAGTFFVQMSVGMNAFITSQGFSKISMATVLIGACLNIVLDPIFIFYFDMGVRGAAIATVLSQAVSAIWVLKFLMGPKTQLRIRKENFRLRKEIIMPVLALGLAPFVMQSTESLVSIVLNSSLQKYGGDIAVGAMTIISSVSMMGMMPLSGIMQGSQPIMGYNFGAKNADRVIKTFKISIMCTLTYSITLWAIVQFFPQVFVGIFTSDPVLLEFTSTAIKTHMACIFMMGAQVACQQAFMALGQAKIALVMAMLRKIIILIPLVLILPGIMGMGLRGIFVATPTADLLATMVTCTVFVLNFKKILMQGMLPDNPEGDHA